MSSYPSSFAIRCTLTPSKPSACPAASIPRLISSKARRTSASLCKFSFTPPTSVLCVTV